MRTKGAGRRFVARLRTVMRTLSVVCLLAFATGCARDVEYLHGSEKITHLRKGEPAPHEGWLLSDDRLAELYDLLEQKLTQEDLPSD